MVNRIKNVMTSIFNIDKNEIIDDSSPDNIEGWDSMAHMNLIVGLEEEFNLLFDETEITEMMNFKLICLIIKEKLLEN